uniref:BioF2-like acetyltransferase domain-containing protein n=1 Tax=Magnetococcus massalia (strain MO-1) TaxID=451514 RepID=A0A1S7LHT9_MAGMO|nr:protein of unknown function [Candidatus Magnetococcus massalia]
MSHTPWEILWLTSWQEIEAASFVEQWHRWFAEDQLASPFFAPEVVMAWLESYRAQATLTPCFLIAKNQNVGKLFLPMVKRSEGWKGGWKRVLVPVGEGEFDYHDPIVVRGDRILLLSTFWDYFVSILFKGATADVDRCHIPRLRVGVSCNGEGDETVDVAPFMRFADFPTQGDPASLLKSKTRQKLKRLLRKLREQSDATHGIQLHCYGADELEQACSTLPELLRLHTLTWPLSYKVPQWHERLLSRGLKQGVVHYSVLRLGEQIISYHLGFHHNQRFYWYMPVYPINWADYSPGQLHLLLLMERLAAEGYKVFDFLRGAEAYKYRWSANEYVLVRKAWQNPATASRLRLAFSAQLVQLKGMLLSWKKGQ